MSSYHIMSVIRIKYMNEWIRIKVNWYPFITNVDMLSSSLSSSWGNSKEKPTRPRQRIRKIPVLFLNHEFMIIEEEYIKRVMNVRKEIIRTDKWIQHWCDMRWDEDEEAFQLFFSLNVVPLSNCFWWASSSITVRI